mgnify:CR=1 FL=1
MIDIWVDWSNYTIGLHFDKLSGGKRPTAGVALYLLPFVFVLHGYGYKRKAT